MSHIINRDFWCETEIEAKAFAAGVEFVNDSAIKIVGIRKTYDGWIVDISDDDFDLEGTENE